MEKKEATLKKTCASCPKGDYWRCIRECPTYARLNTPCIFCGNTPTISFNITTAKGLQNIYVCPKCFNILMGERHV